MSYNLAALLGGGVDPSYNFAALRGGSTTPSYNLAAIEGGADHMPYWPPTEHGRRRAVHNYHKLVASNYRGAHGAWEAILRRAKQQERERIGKYRGKYPYTVERMREEWRDILGDADFRAAIHHRHLANVPHHARHRIQREIDRFLRANPRWPPAAAAAAPPPPPPPAGAPPGGAPPPAGAPPPPPPPAGGPPPGGPPPPPGGSPPGPRRRLTAQTLPPPRVRALTAQMAHAKYQHRTKAWLKQQVSLAERGNDDLIRAMHDFIDLFWGSTVASPPPAAAAPAAPAPRRRAGISRRSLQSLSSSPRYFLRSRTTTTQRRKK